MEDRLAVSLVWKSAHEGREVAGKIPAHCVTVHRHHQLVLGVVKRATVWSYGPMRRVSGLVVAVAASQRCGYLRKCVAVGSDCKEEMRHFRHCFLQFLQALEWKVEVEEAAVAADAQQGVWLMMESSFPCLSSHNDAGRLQGERVPEVLQVFVAEDRPMSLAENLDTDRGAWRVVKVEDRCSQPA